MDIAERATAFIKVHAIVFIGILMHTRMHPHTLAGSARVLEGINAYALQRLPICTSVKTHCSHH